MALTNPFAGLFATIKAIEGNRGPLVGRVLNQAVTLTIWEREYIATVLNPRRRGPRTSEAKKIRARSESLAAARAVIRLSDGYVRWKIQNAVLDARLRNPRAEKTGEKYKRCSETKMKAHLRVAQHFLEGEWWRNNCRLAREGKGHKLL
jgi:hypothetical protein